MPLPCFWCEVLASLSGQLLWGCSTSASDCSLPANGQVSDDQKLTAASFVFVASRKNYLKHQTNLNFELTLLLLTNMTKNCRKNHAAE